MLFYAQTYGKFWIEGDEQSRQERLHRRFPVGGPGPARSLGAFAFETGRTYVTYSSDSEAYYPEAQTKGMIVAPIKIENMVFGVLDIRQTGQRRFSEEAVMMATLLGQQIGLYYYLASTLRELRRSEEYLESLKNQQIQTFKDLTHQLRSPVMVAAAQAQSLLHNELTDVQRSTAQAIRGLCSKAERVVLSTRLFAELASNEPIQVNRTNLSIDTLLRMVLEAAKDNQVLADPDRKIRFNVDVKSFKSLPIPGIAADRDLLNQAIGNVLDNADKYSFPNTTITILGALSRRGCFSLNFINEGLRISFDETKLAARRGWRSSLASQVVGEGSGIGLWITKSIMDAHQGELVIFPTTDEGITEIRLIFPIT